jgi:hypothetical protein
MNPNIPPYSPGWANTQYPRSGVYSGTPIPPSSGVPIGSPYAIIPGIVQNGATIEPMYRVDTRTGVREPLYQSPQGFAPTAPGIFAPTAPGIMRYETPPGYVPLAPGIDTPEEWIMGFGTSQWDRYNLTAGKPDEIDTTEDWIYGYDRDAINDPRTNFSLSQSLEKLPFGVFSWDRNPLVTQ